MERTETRPYGRFDVIFCRNVLIYFDDASRRVAAENLYENRRPGGFICLGHSESMSRFRLYSKFVASRTRSSIGDRWKTEMTEPKSRILIVDDAALVRLYYRKILEGAGYELEEALNGLRSSRADFRRIRRRW